MFVCFQCTNTAFANIYVRLLFCLFIYLYFIPEFTSIRALAPSNSCIYIPIGVMPNTNHFSDHGAYFFIGFENSH